MSDMLAIGQTGVRAYARALSRSAPAADDLVQEAVLRALRAEAQFEPGTELRLFGKPESFTKRRMGVALARDEDVDRARDKAKRAAGRVRPRATG